jgi:FlaA1/EpsC-like NDP-sugar epimerase
MWRTLAWILPLQAGIFLAFGLYRGLAPSRAARPAAHLLAAGLGAVAIPVVLVMLQLTSVVPRSVLILYPLVLIFLMAGSRFSYRIWKEHRLYSPLAALGEPVLILGAGEAGALLTKELAHSRQWRVVGLLDDDRAKQGRLLRNVSVLGPISELPVWVRRYGVRTVIIALPSAAHGVRRRVAELCAAAGLEALTVPSYEDLISGRSQLTTIRHVELDDLPAATRSADSAGLRGRGRGDASPAPAARSAPNCAARSRVIGPRGWCSSNCPSTRSIRSSRRWKTSSPACRWSRSSATPSMRRWSSGCSSANDRRSSSTRPRTSTCR